MISFDDFKKVQLRTAKVLEVGVHPNADRLLVLEVDLGEMGRRQVVAGMRSHYEPEELVGKTVIVVTNLEPVELRGERSEGMMLAVLSGETACLLTTDREVGAGLEVS